MLQTGCELRATLHHDSRWTVLVLGLAPGACPGTGTGKGKGTGTSSPGRFHTGTALSQE